MDNNTRYLINNRVLFIFIIYILFIHVVSAVYYWELASSSEVLCSFKQQFVILLLVSLFFSLVAFVFFVKTGKKIIILFIIQWITLLILGYPLGEDLFIETLLTSGLLLQIVFIQKKTGRSLLLILPVILLFMLLQHKTRYSGLPVAAPPLILIIVQAFLLLSLTGTASWLRGLFVKNNSLDIEVQELKTASGRLINTNRSFQEYAYKIEKQSIDQERTRLSRELHDIIGYTMVSISMMMEDVIDKHVREEYEHIFPIIINTRDLARSAHQEIRDVLMKFRKESDAKRPFLNELYNMVQVFSDASGVNVALKAPQKLPHLSQEYSYQIMRIIQEGFTNALYHGKAKNIEIILIRTKTGITLIIQDDGIGAEVLTEGIGITGMRERLKIMKGTILIYNKKNSFRLTINIPVDCEEE